LHTHVTCQIPKAVPTLPKKIDLKDLSVKIIDTPSRNNT